MGVTISQWDVAQKLFEGAIALEPDERASYLQNACPTDPGLRTAVLNLVRLYEGDPTFLETPVLTQLLTTPQLVEGEVVAGRFRIVRHVGSGGMSEVHEAEDLVHRDRPERVALKMIRPGLAGVNDLVDRIHAEVQLAHRITHPNVCKVHSLHVDRQPSGDRLFLIMDFLDGETLRERVARTGPLDTATALSVAEQIAAGVDEAHREGVIHKDLKSSNIMLVARRDGTTRAVITDFGIAAAEEDAFKRGTGTEAYMAPERMIDAGATRAADIYSFGVVLYEMVTGRLPFDSGTPPDQRRKSPPMPSTIRPSLGRRWDRVILRCLHPSADARFQRATDAVAALRPKRVWIPIAAAVLAGLLAWPLVARLLDRAGGGTATVIGTVSILPFEIVGGSGIQAGLIDHLAEQIQKNPLMRTKWMVLSPADARETGVTTLEKARAAGATHVLAGTVTAEGSAVTIAAQLLEAATARVVGGFQKTCPLDDEVCLQGGLLREFARVLDPQTSLAAQPSLIAKQALPYYAQGLEYLRRDSVSYDIAIKFFQQAIARDSAAVQPRVALADAYALRFRDTGDKTSLSEARMALQEALISSPDLPELHASIGNIHRLDGHYADAINELQQAVQAEPSNHIFQRLLGDAYADANRDAEAAKLYEDVIAVQPRYWAGYNSYAAFHYRRGRYDEAANLWEQLIQWTPDHAQALANLGAAYIALGRNADAENVSKRSCALRPHRACFVNLGMALQRQRRSEEAIAAYDRALALGPPSLQLLVNTADAYAYLKRRGKALEYFDRAVTRARDGVSGNLQDSSQRAMLAYCLAQTGDRTGATFEMRQALQHSPKNKDVQKYGVLTFESMGERDSALEVLRSVTPQVLQDLELAWGTEQLRRDPRYEDVAREVRSK
jgi:eukaryotic-like serine/threonine-protein kinase